MKYTLEFQTITETFLSGADQMAAEFRWPAISGALRFWFRALMGKVVGNNREELRRLEALVFGATDSACPFRPRLRTMGTTSQTGRPPGFENGSGAAYLAFSSLQNRRPWFPHSTKFSISLLFVRPDSLLAEVVIGSFWLLCHFGGIGARTRRGFGAIALLSPSPLPGLSFSVGTTSLRQHFTDNLQYAEKAFAAFARRHGFSSESKVSGPPQFTCFQQWSGRLVYRDGWEDIHCLLDDTGRLLRGLRVDLLSNPPDSYSLLAHEGHTQDFDQTVLPFLEDDAFDSGELQNAMLGLPLIAFSSTRKNQNLTPFTANLVWEEATPEHRNKIQRRDRRASPLFFRPIPLPRGLNGPRFGLVIALFPAQFLPVQEMQLRAKEWPALAIKTPEVSEIQSFADAFYKQVDRWFDRALMAQAIRVILP